MKAKPHNGGSTGPRLGVSDAQNIVLTHSSFTYAPPLGSEVVSERALYRRAVEAALWGLPLVSFASMRHAYLRDAGANDLDMVYWSNPELSTKRTPAPHQTAVALVFASLRAGPLVLEIPPLRGSVFVSLFDAWSEELPRGDAAGNEDVAGGRYVLIPPGQDAPRLDGCTPLHASTLEVGCSIRVAPETAKVRELVRVAVLVKKLRIRPLLVSASTPPSRFIDMTGSRFDGVPPRDASFFARLAQMVVEQPPRASDAAMLGLLGTLGIRKGARFQPTPEMSDLLAGAIVEAAASVTEGRRGSGARYWPTRRWRTRWNAEGPAESLDLSAHEPAALCLRAFDDVHGEPLDGSRTYRLHLPPAVPTRRHWSVTAYDDETSAFIDGAPVVAVSSRDPRLRVNPDGSTDLYFAPRRPEGGLNWIATSEARRFFVAFRNYAPDPYVVSHVSRWTMSDLTPVEGPASSERAPAEAG